MIVGLVTCVTLQPVTVIRMWSRLRKSVSTLSVVASCLCVLLFVGGDVWRLLLAWCLVLEAERLCQIMIKSQNVLLRDCRCEDVVAKVPVLWHRLRSMELGSQLSQNKQQLQCVDCREAGIWKWQEESSRCSKCKFTLYWNRNWQKVIEMSKEKAWQLNNKCDEQSSDMNDDMSAICFEIIAHNELNDYNVTLFWSLIMSSGTFRNSIYMVMKIPPICISNCVPLVRFS